MSCWLEPGNRSFHNRAHAAGEKFNLRAFRDFVWKNGNVPIALQRWEYLGAPAQRDIVSNDRKEILN